MTCLPKADLLIPSVSAASVLAKVARDDFMAEQDDIYPGYDFKKHAGYGVAAHRAAIEALGVCELHRLSFAPLHKYRNTASVSTPDIASVSCRKKSSLISRLPAVLATRSSLSEKRDDFSGLPSAKLGVDTEASSTTRQIGNESEGAVAGELVRRGHTICERNWRTRWCEVDIISEKAGTLYFTEVKHRKNDKAGDGFDAITPKKLQQMKFAAELYAAKNPGFNLRLVAAKTTGEPPVLSDMLYIE